VREGSCSCSSTKHAARLKLHELRRVFAEEAVDEHVAAQDVTIIHWLKGATYGAFMPPVMSTDAAGAAAAVGALELLGRGVGTSLSEEEESTARRFDAGRLEEEEDGRLEEGGVDADGFFFFLCERGNDMSRGGGTCAGCYKKTVREGRCAGCYKKTVQGRTWRTGLTVAARRRGLPHSSIGNRLRSAVDGWMKSARLKGCG
jgi:hypothetical protein